MTIAKLPVNSRDYVKGRGYDVTLDVSYRRVRKVRAISPEQAVEFAVARESDYAVRYFNSNSHIHFEITDVKSAGVAPASERTGKIKAASGPDGTGEQGDK